VTGIGENTLAQPVKPPLRERRACLAKLVKNRLTLTTALAWLCGHLGEPLADAWAFGDNINDIPMLQAAGHGTAMINAEPEDREAAGAITEYDNDHDGVARAVMAALA